MSNTLTAIPEEYRGKVELLKGNLKTIVKEIHNQGFDNLYVDGGKTIQNFLKEDLIDEMTITIIPYLLGGGLLLFTQLPRRLDFECVDTKLFLGKIVQNRFVRKR